MILSGCRQLLTTGLNCRGLRRGTLAWGRSTLPLADVRSAEYERRHYIELLIVTVDDGIGYGCRYLLAMYPV